jgi:hypothetical protein
MTGNSKWLITWLVTITLLVAGCQTTSEVAEAYKKPLEGAGNPHFQIEVLPCLDHGQLPARSGCLDEVSRGNYLPDDREILEAWIGKLN